MELEIKIKRARKLSKNVFLVELNSATEKEKIMKNRKR
jgi:hypothetical protein